MNAVITECVPVLFRDDNKVLEQVLYSVDQLQNTVPEIRPFMHLVNEYMAVTDRSMQQTLSKYFTYLIIIFYPFPFCL